VSFEGKWLYWQPILTKPNLWAGLTQLATFPPHLAFHVGKWLYWQPILTEPNLWAGLTQLATFPPHLPFHAGK
jgi:hypothetical protein